MIENWVNQSMKQMENIAHRTEPQKTKNEDLQEVVSQLNTKKAKDRDNWSNEIIVSGGNEMRKSLFNIFCIIDTTLSVPVEWNKMAIRTKDKRGSKLEMTNKRGLFLTNIISKVYERIMKKRNKKQMKEKSSPWQMGGVDKRSTVDNHFITF